MITKTQKEAFKSTLGKHYTDKVMAVLSKNKIVSAKGIPHTANMVRQVFNGNTQNDAIEVAIITCVKEQKQAKKKLECIKQQLIS